MSNAEGDESNRQANAEAGALHMQRVPLCRVVRRVARDLALAATAWVIVRAVLFGVEVQQKYYGLVCHKNLLQVSLGLHMYASDWDGRLPPSSDWMNRVAPMYLGNEGVFHCPAIGDGDPARFGYALNSRVVGRSIDKIKRPETIPLVFDSANLSRNAADPFTSLPDPPRHLKNRAIYLDHQVRPVPLQRRLSYEPSAK